MRAAAGEVIPPRTEPDPDEALHPDEARCPNEAPSLNEALRAASRGDEAGFVVLYRDLQPRLLRYATALIGAEAEDVTAETWLQVARDLRGFEGDVDGFRGWVSTICRNRAMDWARTRTRRPADPTEMETLTQHPDTGDAHGSAVEGMSTRWAMDQILALPQTEAEAVLLRAVVGLDAPTAAKVLGKRPGAVRVAAHRGLKKLAKTIRNDQWTAGEGHA